VGRSAASEEGSAEQSAASEQESAEQSAASEQESAEQSAASEQESAEPSVVSDQGSSAGLQAEQERAWALLVLPQQHPFPRWELTAFPFLFVLFHLRET
jgi:hypothetical protein